MIVEGAFVEKALSELIRGWTAWFRRKAAKKVFWQKLSCARYFFNAAVLYEAKNISSEAQLGFNAPSFLGKRQASAIEIIFASGFPLGELFKGPWTESEPEHANQLRSCLRGFDTKTELPEKALHRVLVLKILAQENILEDSIKFD